MSTTTRSTELQAEGVELFCGAFEHDALTLLLDDESREKDRMKGDPLVYIFSTKRPEIPVIRTVEDRSRITASRGSSTTVRRTCPGRITVRSRASFRLSPLSSFSITWGICFSLRANPSTPNARGFVTVLPRSPAIVRDYGTFIRDTFSNGSKTLPCSRLST
jgi:hypothetical protein